MSGGSDMVSNVIAEETGGELPYETDGDARRLA